MCSRDTSSITLTWSATSDDVAVAGYHLFLNGTKVASTGATSHGFGALSCGTGYTIGVAAYDAAGNRSSTSALTSATAACSETTPPDTGPPTPPSSLQVGAADQSSIRLSWSAASDDVAVTGYYVFLNGEKVGSTTATSYTFSGLNCGASYTLAVQAYDAAANVSTQSSVVVATSPCLDTSAPTVPTGLAATAGSTSVSALWSPSFDNFGVSGYDVFLNGSKVGSTLLTNYTFGGLTCGTSYTVGVDAYDAGGNVSAKATVTAATSACQGSTGPSIGYRFAYSNRSDQNLMPQYGFNLIDVSTKSEADATPAGTQGQLWLYDYDNNTCGWEKDDTYIRNMVSSVANDPKVAGFYFSNEPDPFACPNAPQQHKDRSALIKSLAPTIYSLIGIDANWRQHYDKSGTMWKGTADFVNYNPYICYVGQPCDFAWEDHVLQVAQSLGQPYFVTLQAFKEGTEWRWPTAAEESQMLDRLKDPSLSGLSGYMTFSWNWNNDPLLNHPDVLGVIKDFNLGTSTAPADTTAPSTPTGLSKTASTGTNVSLAWSPSTDNVAVAGYGVYKNGTLVSTTSGASYTVGGLACGTSYTFSVDAYDAAGNRSAKTSLTAATSSSCTDTLSPNAPGNLTATAATQTSISTLWSPSFDDVGVNGYDVFLNDNKIGLTPLTGYTFSARLRHELHARHRGLRRRPEPFPAGLGTTTQDFCASRRMSRSHRSGS
jgi:chitodextrinase